MSRLIDANDVVKAILAERDKIPRTISVAPYELGTEKLFHAGDQMRGGIRKALRCIEQAPTVDAVPVVRCRDCEHRTKLRYDGQYHCCNADAGMATGVALNDNDFCSYGKQKEGDKND